MYEIFSNGPIASGGLSDEEIARRRYERRARQRREAAARRKAQAKKKRNR